MKNWKNHSKKALAIALLTIGLSLPGLAQEPARDAAAKDPAPTVTETTEDNTRLVAEPTVSVPRPVELNLDPVQDWPDYRARPDIPALPNLQEDRDDMRIREFSDDRSGRTF